jgi:hypothetical protein
LISFPTQRVCRAPVRQTRVYILAWKVETVPLPSLTTLRKKNTFIPISWQHQVFTSSRTIFVANFFPPFNTYILHSSFDLLFFSFPFFQIFPLWSYFPQIVSAVITVPLPRAGYFSQYIDTWKMLDFPEPVRPTMPTFSAARV